MASTDFQTRTDIFPKTRKELPPQYKVILHNDDYTTMEFVVEILITVFGKPLEKATQTMLNIHHKGNAVCGIYTREIAETKVETVHQLASSRGFPLKSTMEKE
ncbi:MAG: ATP-dependent Clp protease adapter ClpS [Desulfotignum sp.]|nr:ATP-dependent Clp protease adapter ClpS [Desulfotignum sp.]MCF8087376.1 ATP-dependent Clp protease adapter ClpS [Desulfotignum sp.]MCF8135734.1 ATP-dependent Clp protease adapter ClpS [Desulfotignum sp.]